MFRRAAALCVRQMAAGRWSGRTMPVRVFSFSAARLQRLRHQVVGGVWEEVSRAHPRVVAPAAWFSTSSSKSDARSQEREKVSGELEALLRILLRRAHPDVVTPRFPKEGAYNMDSLQLMNAFLSALDKAARLGSLSPLSAQPSALSVSFYLLPQSTEKQDDSDHSPEGDLTLSMATFVTPGSVTDPNRRYWSRPMSAGELSERLVVYRHLLLLMLLNSCNVEVPEKRTSSVMTEARRLGLTFDGNAIRVVRGGEEGDVKEKRKHAVDMGFVNREIRDELRKELLKTEAKAFPAHREHTPGYTRTDAIRAAYNQRKHERGDGKLTDLSESKGFTHIAPIDKKPPPHLVLKEMVDRAMGQSVVLAHDLLPMERRSAIRAFRENALDLSFHQWSDIPVLIGPSGTEYSSTAVDGFLTIPVDFDVQAVRNLVDREGQRVRERVVERQKDLSKAVRTYLDVKQKLKLRHVVMDDALLPEASEVDWCAWTILKWWRDTPLRDALRISGISRGSSALPPHVTPAPSATKTVLQNGMPHWTLVFEHPDRLAQRNEEASAVEGAASAERVHVHEEFGRIMVPTDVTPEELDSFLTTHAASILEYGEKASDIRMALKRANNSLRLEHGVVVDPEVYRWHGISAVKAAAERMAELVHAWLQHYPVEGDWNQAIVTTRFQYERYKSIAEEHVWGKLIVPHDFGEAEVKFALENLKQGRERDSSVLEKARRRSQQRARAITKSQMKS